MKKLIVAAFIILLGAAVALVLFVLGIAAVAIEEARQEMEHFRD